MKKQKIKIEEDTRQFSTCRSKIQISRLNAKWVAILKD